jgi:large subunit ribosomal protein L4
MDGRELEPMQLTPAVFEVEPNDVLVHEVAVALMNAKRQGNAQVKDRSQVSGGGIKPFRQKGTGRSRQGSSREPQMKGGGTTFGPQKRGYRQNIPTRSRRAALCSVLSARVRDEALLVLDSLAMEAPKTKTFAEMMQLISPDHKRTLFVMPGVEKNVMLSARNLGKVEIKTAAELNALDVLNAYRVVLVRDAVASLEGRLS